MNGLIDTIIASLPQPNNTTSAGCTHFNAPCCYQTGHKPDTEKSGKVIQDSNSIRYYCSNCGYEASWQTESIEEPSLRHFLDLAAMDRSHRIDNGEVVVSVHRKDLAFSGGPHPSVHHPPLDVCPVKKVSTVRRTCVLVHTNLPFGR